MSASNKNSTDIIVKDVHCPYCGKDEALLISKTTHKTTSLQMPAYGLKWLLSVLYLSFLHIIVYGFKVFEFRKKIDSVTYGFCPHCGNSYSMAPPDEIKEEITEEKFYRVRDGKIVSGFCKGVSEYTGISLLWIRIMTVIYTFTVIGFILYFLISFCIPFKEDVENDVTKKLCKIKNGKWIAGICKGISVHTEIPVAWIRILAVLFAPIIIVIIAYIIAAAKLRNEDEENDIPKKLCTVKNGKWIMGVCKGISVRTDIPVVWIRILAVLFAPTIVLIIAYFIAGAKLPTMEGNEIGK